MHDQKNKNEREQYDPINYEEYTLPPTHIKLLEVWAAPELALLLVLLAEAEPEK